MHEHTTIDLSRLKNIDDTNLNCFDETVEEFKKLGVENIYRFQETMIYISQNIVSQVFKYVFLATFFLFLTLIPGTYKLWKLSCYWIVPYILILWSQRFLNISHNIFWENNILEIIMSYILEIT